ncbi:hypothetical protein ENBRE01_1218 [Enteropsectra breve]|nr:hypothetical protein ENBRE01_1218 [Enteropsectra breve]
MNPKQQYLYKLLNYYASKDSAAYVISKICQKDAQNSHVFCRTCFHIFIPKVNCTTKIEDSIFQIECRDCRLKSEFKVST